MKRNQGDVGPNHCSVRVFARSSLKAKDRRERRRRRAVGSASRPFPRWRLVLPSPASAAQLQKRAMIVLPWFIPTPGRWVEDVNVSPRGRTVTAGLCLLVGVSAEKYYFPGSTHCGRRGAAEATLSLPATSQQTDGGKSCLESHQRPRLCSRQQPPGSRRPRSIWQPEKKARSGSPFAGMAGHPPGSPFSKDSLLCRSVSVNGKKSGGRSPTGEVAPQWGPDPGGSLDQLERGFKAMAGGKGDPRESYFLGGLSS